MSWRKELGSSNRKNTDYLFGAIIILSVIGFIFKLPILFVVMGLFIVLLIINFIYDRKIGEKLTLVNPRDSLKLFPGETGALTFTFHNHSIFPLINGVLKFQADAAIQGLKFENITGKKWNRFNMPLSVMGKRKTTLTLPIRAERRGAARVRNISYTFPHLFQFDRLTLHFEKFYHTEFIVLPELIPVKGVEVAFHLTQGSQITNFSLFEDVQSPRGTRNYSHSDPFHRINWKASAKTQGLQTNVYDKIIDMSYIFIVNLGVQHGSMLTQLSMDMERLISHTAYLCQFAARNGFPYEVFINARKPGKVPYLHIPEGEGGTHYANALEMLARINSQTMMVPFNQMLHRVGQGILKPQTIIIVGEVPEGGNDIIDKWRYNENNIFNVKPSGDEGIMEPWVKEAVYHAR